MAERISTTEKNLNQWGKALKDLEPLLGEIFDQDRMIGIEALDTFNLPRYKRLTMPLPQYLEDPDRHLKSMNSDNLYVSLNPHENNVQRQRRVMKMEEVPGFITTHIKPEDSAKFDILILQYFENVYGGNIVVTPDNSMIIEFRDGYQGPVASGEETPKYFAYRDVFTRLFKYSFEDPKLRDLIYRTIQIIPHQKEGREAIYLPGYYEFALVRNKETLDLEPKFIDLKQNLAQLFRSDVCEAIKGVLQEGELNLGKL